MNISVDFNGIDEMKETRTYNMSRLAFVKHLAVAEQGYQPSLHKLLRTFSRFVLFSPYLKKEAFRGNNFALPPNIYWNPNDRRLYYDFASVAIADFLSKKIDNGLYTNNLRKSGVPRRLLCFSNDHIFSIDTRMQREPGNARNINSPQNHLELNIIDVNYSVSAVTWIFQ